MVTQRELTRGVMIMFRKYEVFPEPDLVSDLVSYIKDRIAAECIKLSQKVEDGNE